MLAPDHPRTTALIAAVDAGDIEALERLLVESPGLASERFGDESQSQTALHVATDWPGHRPRVADIIGLLVAAGAPVDGRFAGPHTETALHWAASADDVAAIDALLEAGADIEADGAVLTGGTPLADAVVFAQWNAARRLVERGARMTIWQAAALGHVDEVERLIPAVAASPIELDNACWHACRAGHLVTARLLVERGADLDWLGHEGLTTRRAGLQSGDSTLVDWLRRRG